MSKDRTEHIIETGSYIVICGNSTAGVPDIIHTAKTRYVDKAFEDTDYIEIYADDFAEEDFSNHAASMPMISEKKVIVIRNASSLRKNQAEFIDNMSDSMANIMLIIVYADEMQQANENVRKAKTYFRKAVFIEKKRYDSVSDDDVENIAHMYGMELNRTQISSLKAASLGNAETVRNILGICWMTGDMNMLRENPGNEGIIENVPVLHYRFLEMLLERNPSCIEIYKNLIKWKVMNLDSIIILVLSKIAEKRQIVAAYAEGGEDAVRQLSGPNSPAFRFTYAHNKKIYQLWSLFDMDNVYNLFYGILRQARTVKREHAEMLFEQAVIKAIKHQGELWI